MYIQSRQLQESRYPVPGPRSLTYRIPFAFKTPPWAHFSGLILVSFRYSPASPCYPGLPLFLPFTSIAFYVDFLVDGSFGSRLVWKSREVSPPVQIHTYIFLFTFLRQGFVVETPADDPSSWYSFWLQHLQRTAKRGGGGGRGGIMRGGGRLEVGGWLDGRHIPLIAFVSVSDRRTGR